MTVKLVGITRRFSVRIIGNFDLNIIDRKRNTLLFHIMTLTNSRNNLSTCIDNHSQIRTAFQYIVMVYIAWYIFPTILSSNLMPTFKNLLICLMILSEIRTLRTKLTFVFQSKVTSFLFVEVWPLLPLVTLLFCYSNPSFTNLS